MGAARKEAPSPAPTLTGERVTLRAVEPDDVPTLRAFLQDPSVARWWGPVRSEVDVADDWKDADPDTTVWTIEVDGAVAGSIQSAEETEPDYRHASIDVRIRMAHGTRDASRSPAAGVLRSFHSRCVEATRTKS